MKPYFLALCSAIAVNFAISGEVKLDDIQIQIETPKKEVLEPGDAINLRLRVKAQNDTRALALMAQALRLGLVGENTFADYKPRQKLAIYALTPDNTPNLKNPEACLEFARIMAQDTPEDAILFIDELGQKTQGRQRIWAAETCADIALKAKRYEMALEYYKLAEAFCKVEYGEDPLVKLALQRIEQSKRNASRVKDILQYGEEFVLYREAEELRTWGNAKEALEKYNEVMKKYEKTVFAKASEVYAGYCYQKLGKFTEAEKAWTRLVNREQWGLYNGEALVALGELRLNQFLDLNGSLAWFQRVDSWLKGIEKCGVDFGSMQPPEKSAKVTKSPQDVVLRDQWGNVLHARPAAGALVNHITTPWYLDELRLRHLSGYGFLSMVSGNTEQAKRIFEEYHKLDKLGQEQEKWAMGSFAQRMRWNLNENKGCLRAFPQEAAAFADPTRRLVMFLGDLQYEHENWPGAKGVYQSLLDAKYGKLMEAETAYLISAVAQCDSRSDNEGLALSNLRKFKSEFTNTPTRPRALLLLAKILSGGKRDENNCTEAVTIFDRLAVDYPEPYKEEAIYLAAMTEFFSKNADIREDAKHRFVEYRKQYPAGFYQQDASEENLAFLDDIRTGKPINWDALKSK